MSPRIAVTGSAGFVGWHVRCAARARWGGDAICLDVAEFQDPDVLDAALAQADAVVHLAGVNRANHDAEIAKVNRVLAVGGVRNILYQVDVVRWQFIYAH